MPKKHTIDSISAWLNKAAILQAFSTLAAAIIQASAAKDTYGAKVASEMYGDDDGTYPISGEVVIGRVGGLIVTMEIKPAKSGWMGEHLTHEEINAIGVSGMVVDGESLRPKEK